MILENGKTRNIFEWRCSEGEVERFKYLESVVQKDGGFVEDM